MPVCLCSTPISGPRSILPWRITGKATLKHEEQLHALPTTSLFKHLTVVRSSGPQGHKGGLGQEGRGSCHKCKSSCHLLVHLPRGQRSLLSPNSRNQPWLVEAWLHTQGFLLGYCPWYCCHNHSAIISKSRGRPSHYPSFIFQFLLSMDMPVLALFSA